MNRLKYILSLLLLLGCSDVFAQQIIYVSGKILNLQEGEKKPKPFPKNEVMIHAFNTIAAAEDQLKAIENAGAGVYINSDNSAYLEPDGYFEISVAETGALLIHLMNHMKYEIIEVRGRREITKSISTDRQLGEVEVVAPSLIPDPEPQASEIEGNNLYIKNTFPITDQLGKPNARLIIQPYVVNCQTKDTVTYARPFIVTGGEYVETQERRMLFDKERDPLMKHEHFSTEVKKSFNNSSKFNLPYNDTVYIADPTVNYMTMYKMVVEDYSNIYYQSEKMLNTCETRRPLHFLETAFPAMQMDPMSDKPLPRREKRPTNGSIKLGFLVGKAQLDPENPTNEVELNKIHTELRAMVNDPAVTLKTFEIVGVSSPEGARASNEALAKQRTDFAYREITSVIPSSVMRTVFTSKDSRIAGWDEVAALLEADTLLNEAAEVRAIVEEYKNPDAQYAKIRQLPYYNTAIKDRLPLLRTVQYKYTYEIFRELEPEEILEKYETEEEYRNGTKSFTLYEYWHLFQMVKDKKELEVLYKRACEDSKGNYNGKPWPLAANNLAVSYLERDTFDINLLEPLIDLGVQKVNFQTTFDTGMGIEKTIVNPEEIVINHLAMCIKANNFSKASVIAQILPDEPKYETVRAFARCLGGYYKGGSTVEEQRERKHIFEIVRNSTPLNNVVMCLAMQQAQYDNEAWKLLETFPQDESLTWYLKAVAQKRLQGTDGAIEEAWFEYFGFPIDENSQPYQGKNAVGCLIQAFILNKSLIEYAISDGDIGEKFYNEAMAIWEETKNSAF